MNVREQVDEWDGNAWREVHKESMKSFLKNKDSPTSISRAVGVGKEFKWLDLIPRGHIRLNDLGEDMDSQTDSLHFKKANISASSFQISCHCFVKTKPKEQFRVVDWPLKGVN